MCRGDGERHSTTSASHSAPLPPRTVHQDLLTHCSTTLGCFQVLYEASNHRLQIDSAHSTPSEDDTARQVVLQLQQHLSTHTAHQIAFARTPSVYPSSASANHGIFTAVNTLLEVTLHPTRSIALECHSQVAHHLQYSYAPLLDPDHRHLRRWIHYRALGSCYATV